MSAIFGVFQVDGRPVEPEVLAGMSGALAHRGPDGAGQWREGAVGLGHRALHSTPESVRERQPLVDAATGLVLVADARIDNRAELVGMLGAARPDATDGALILAAYLRWGAECPARLIGDFAFAVWDPRTRSVFCARDPMGVKPFYYHRSGRLFAFATEAKALHGLPGVSRRLDEEQVAIFLAWSQVDREHTLYEGIRRLPAAHSLRVEAGRGSEAARYWSLDPGREIRRSDPGEYAEEFREIFVEAVRARMRSVRPVGTALSGGLDSSSITCVARRLAESSGAQVHAFSLVFPDLPAEELRIIDERRFVESVVRGGGIHWHAVAGDRLSPLRDVERVLWHLDEPFAAPNLFLHWGLYEAAQAQGAGVFLDGLDGDSTVSHGLGRLNGLLGAGEWASFESEVRAFARRREIDPGSVLPHFGLPYLSELARRGRWTAWRRAASEIAGRFPVSRRELLLRHGLAAAVPAWVRRARRAARRDGSDVRRVLHPALARRLPGDAEDGGAAGMVSERDSHLAGLSLPEYQSTLEMADKCAAAFGVEPRYPFFDRRLMEFCLAVPAEQKFADGWTRLLFRRAMEGILPPEIQWRGSKANLSPGFHRGLRSADRALVERTDLGALAPYADVGALHRVRDSFFSEAGRGWGDARAYLLFRATVFSLWHPAAAA